MPPQPRPFVVQPPVQLSVCQGSAVTPASVAVVYCGTRTTW